MFSHPKAVCMTYLTHMAFALEVSVILWVAAAKSVVHAFLPDTFITSTTDLVVDLDHKLKNAGCHGKQET